MPLKSSLLEPEQKVEKIAVLTKFIQSNPDARELKRALAVKLALEGERYAKITQILSMHKSCITTWKQSFEAQGLEGIKLGYKGTKSYLTPEQREKVASWLKTKDDWNLAELVTYLDEHYGVIYQAKQSYYTLMSEANISWKKSQKVNPSAQPELVKKREEIIEFLTKNQAEIEAGQMIVFFGDECHLLWGEVCGYVWGKTESRIEIPLKNEKDRQTYFGALDYQTKEFLVQKYGGGNGENTVAFIKYLQSQRPGKKIALIWDGASDHKSKEIKDFLTTVNQEYEPLQWRITGIIFAPNAPEQNPGEDVWLQAKNFLRKFWWLCRSFSVVKWLFQFFTDHQRFDFPKLKQYATCSELI